jgi:hypothetical protein
MDSHLILWCSIQEISVCFWFIFRMLNQSERNMFRSGMCFAGEEAVRHGSYHRPLRYWDGHCNRIIDLLCSFSLNLRSVSVATHRYTTITERHVRNHEFSNDTTFGWEIICTWAGRACCTMTASVSITIRPMPISLRFHTINLAWKGLVR